MQIRLVPCYPMRPMLILIGLAVCFVIALLVHVVYNNTENSNANHNARIIRRNPPSNLDYDLRSTSKSTERGHDRFYYKVIHTDSGGDNSEQIENVLLRIEDLHKIRLSIRNELKQIEREKANLLNEKASLINKNAKLLSQITKSKAQLKQLDLDISANRRQKFEKLCDNTGLIPLVFKPLSSVDIQRYSLPEYDIASTFKNTTSHSTYAFDLSVCPLTSDFKFYLYQTNEPDNEVTASPTLLTDILINHRQYTSDINQACLVVYILDNPNNTDLNLLKDRNNLIINTLSDVRVELEHLANGALASPVFQGGTFRQKLDVVLPSTWQSYSDFTSLIGSIPPQSPLDRKYLAAYFGRGNAGSKPTTSSQSDDNENDIEPYLSPYEKVLQVIHHNSIEDLFLFVYNCGEDSNTQCFDDRARMLELSTFLIVLPTNELSTFEPESFNQIYLALSRGSIPVVYGKQRLPFDEVIDWNQACIMLPEGRISETHFILRSYEHSDLYTMKYHGRRIFETYLATSKQIIDNVIALISIERFNHPPPPVEPIKTRKYYTNNNNMTIDHDCTSQICTEAKSDSLANMLAGEILGPHEHPMASQSYRRNMSLILNSRYKLWNNAAYSPIRLYPSHPDDPMAPSEFKFIATDSHYRPIADGAGGSGSEFSRALGGDWPTEQFTIVLLTYERINLLMKTLTRFKGLAYLNKVIVVWNGVKRPPTNDLVWPDIGVPIEVVQVERNSLNNRFLPFDAIETDAVFSMDDDSPLRPDEIVFAFRVWRESRDRIVGFPGRYHAWDSNLNTWVYNSNHSCELSMVLTGGAFYHKYYSYLYTFNMATSIRSVVDKFMNCEDIAMNFLVAHITRKPPIKVTSRWTFHCDGCQTSLSEDESHFRERHECLNIFASIYGYMPLVSTQHRSDSILFKTRLPRDKQKCFKYV